MNWDDIIGHERQVQVLRAVLNRQRNAHAYVFSGEAGVGKRTVAQVTAYALACTSQSEGNVPCGMCNSCCSPITDHPDIHEIVSSGSTIKIEQIRMMQRQMMFRPTLGRRKVYIIDQAASMTLQAQNAFLKSLEEPPEFIVFLLVTDNTEQLLPTVRSRCVPIRFSTVPIRSIEKRLLRDGMSSQQAKKLAEASFGRPGYVLQKETSEIETEQKAVADWVKQLRSGSAAIWHVGNSIEALGDDAPFFIDLLILYLRQMFFGADHAPHSGESAQQARDHNESMHGHMSGVADSIEALLDLKQHWERHANVRLALDVALIKLQRGLRSA